MGVLVELVFRDTVLCSYVASDVCVEGSGYWFAW